MAVEKLNIVTFEVWFGPADMALRKVKRFTDDSQDPKRIKATEIEAMKLANIYETSNMSVDIFRVDEEKTIIRQKLT